MRGDLHSRLTPRERIIAQLVAEGHSNGEIAQLLGISKRTAENHLMHVKDKLQVWQRDKIAVPS